MGDSVQVAPLLYERRGLLMSFRPRWQAAVLLLLIAWLYGSILVRLFAQFWIDKNTAHGYFVPLFSAFVLWQDRNNLRKIQAKPSWTGALILAGGLVVLALGDLGAELFLSRVSLLFVLAGLTILFWGWDLFRGALFPWAFLFLMIPLPNLIFQKITFPLQTYAAQLASTLLPYFDVPVLREGNVINLPGPIPLEVAEACSGIRSLLSLITLAIIYGYLMDTRQWVRILLTASAIPIAVVANSLRIVGTGLVVHYWDAQKGEGFYHTFEAWLVFVVSLAMLFGLHHVVNRVTHHNREVRV
jgi:exosortase